MKETKLKRIKRWFFQRKTNIKLKEFNTQIVIVWMPQKSSYRIYSIMDVLLRNIHGWLEIEYNICKFDKKLEEQIIQSVKNEKRKGLGEKLTKKCSICNNPAKSDPCEDCKKLSLDNIGIKIR